MMVAAGTPVVSRDRHRGSCPAGTGGELRDAGAGRAWQRPRVPACPV